MVITTQKAAQGFRIPIRTGKLVFHGDWEGAEVTVRIDVPVQVFMDIQDLVALEQPLKTFDIFGEKIIVDWNIQDEDGLPIEPTGVGMGKVPIRLANLIVEQWVEVATQPSIPLGEN